MRCVTACSWCLTVFLKLLLSAMSVFFLCASAPKITMYSKAFKGKTFVVSHSILNFSMNYGLFACQYKSTSKLLMFCCKYKHFSTLNA